MANFNTYQTRQLYVAKAIDSSVDTNGDIALKTTANGKAFFSYRNGDGLLTATDVFDVKNISSLKKTLADDMNTPLMAYSITVDTSAVTLSNLIGKTVSLNVGVHQIVSFDYSDAMNVAASIIGDATNTASSAAFYKAMANALIKVMPALPEVPFEIYLVKSGAATKITKSLALGSYPSDATSIVITQVPQKYIRGKMSNDPYGLSVSFAVAGSNTESIVWGAVAEKTIAALNTASSVSISPASIASVYKIADLEAFAMGERGDYYRGSNWPNNYEPTYMIDLSKKYNVLSIEYFWQGGAENVQKSPRMIQVAAEAAVSDDIVTTLYNNLLALTPEGRLEAVETAVASS